MPTIRAKGRGRLKNFQTASGLYGHACGARDFQAFFRAHVDRVFGPVAADDVAIAEHDQFVDGQLRPGLVACQRQGGDDGDFVVRGGNFGKIDHHVVVQKPRFAERCFAHDIVQQRAGMGKQTIAVGHDEVEQSVAADFVRQRGDGVEQGSGVGLGGKSVAQTVEDVAERAFGIGGADGMVILALLGIEINQMSVVREEPVFAPHFAHEGMGVGQRGLSLRGFADVGDDVFGFDLVGANQVGDGGVGAGFVVVKQTHAASFEEADAETVGVVVGDAATAAEAFK